MQALTTKKQLKKQDFYGQYIINRSYFPGRQANWQYDSFRFEIKKNDSLYFYVLQRGKIAQTYKGAISTLKPYSSHRLVVQMNQPTHHVMESNPTIYRDAWGFYLVFNSPRFGNMFFIKGSWEAREI
ncbi:hypothetical protein GCM10023185_26060 [Hymenobacter saemangeumensis]|uniref:Uncharacterized protein n=2 Tax=Hymenobacter saemangeumensis TaxID=1084522 RepID=A0ABP8IIK3_9BACT